MNELLMRHRPDTSEPRLVMGFTGWMDGGRVSTGTIEMLARATEAVPFADIDPLEFYVLNFPLGGLPITLVSEDDKTVARSVDPMEQAAMFRPHAEIEGGTVREISLPHNEFLCSADGRLVLFSGEEPHIRWRSYGHCIMDVVEEFGVREMCFIGSVASPIPHTREPRVWATVSGDAWDQSAVPAGVLPTNYEGPSSFITYLLTEAGNRGVHMSSMVVELPHYPFLGIPMYPASIVRVLDLLRPWLGLEDSFGDLRKASATVRQQLDQLMDQHGEFRALVRRLEDAYDAEEVPDDEHLLRRLIDDLDFGDDLPED